MRRSSTICATLLLLTAALSAGAEGPPACHRPVDYSVLTPGLEGKHFVLTGQDLTIIGANRFANMGQTKALRQLAERARYEPWGRLSSELMAAGRGSARRHH